MTQYIKIDLKRQLSEYLLKTIKKRLTCELLITLFK